MRGQQRPTSGPARGYRAGGGGRGAVVPGPMAYSGVKASGQPHGGSGLSTGDREMRKTKPAPSGELGGRAGGRNIYPDSHASPGALAQSGRELMEPAENTCKLPLHRRTCAQLRAQVEKGSQGSVFQVGDAGGVKVRAGRRRVEARAGSTRRAQHPLSIGGWTWG